MGGKIYSYVAYEFFSTPADVIIEKKNAGPIRSELIMASAESGFLKAEAVLKGIISGNAQDFYQEGIRQAMKLWGVGDIDTYLSTEPYALLNGTKDENLEKVATQRWVMSYTDG